MSKYLKKQNGSRVFKNESDFSRWWSRCVQCCDGEVTAIVGHEMQESGLPDRHVAHSRLPGGQAWVECKVDDNKLSLKQRLKLMAWLRRGVFACEMRLKGNNIYINVPEVGGWKMTKTVLEIRRMSAGEAGRYFIDALAFVMEEWHGFKRTCEAGHSACTTRYPDDIHRAAEGENTNS